MGAAALTVGVAARVRRAGLRVAFLAASLVAPNLAPNLAPILASILAPAVVLMAASGGAAAAVGGSPDPAARLVRLQREIDELTAERARLAGEETGVRGRLEALGAEARVLDTRLEALGLEQVGLRTALRQLEARRVAAERRLVETRTRLRATVLLLHRAGPLGGLRVALTAGDARGIAAGARLAQELAARRRDEVAAVRAARDEAALLATATAERAAELEQMMAATGDLRRALARAIESRRALLARVRDGQAVRATAIGELERASAELAELLAGTSAEEGTGARAAAAAAGAGRAARVRLDVRRFRGLLPMPAAGTLASGFGDRRDPRFGTVLPHRGWDIAAPLGAPVRAVFDGRVVWASWFRGYGLMAVVDHGGGVHSVYAHLSAVTAATGDEIAKGQPLGIVGDTGPRGGAYLYFEIREAGRAVDPASWLAPARWREPSG